MEACFRASPKLPFELTLVSISFRTRPRLPRAPLLLLLAEAAGFSVTAGRPPAGELSLDDPGERGSLRRNGGISGSVSGLFDRGGFGEPPPACGISRGGGGGGGGGGGIPGSSSGLGWRLGGGL